MNEKNCILIVMVFLSLAKNWDNLHEWQWCPFSWRQVRSGFQSCRNDQQIYLSLLEAPAFRFNGSDELGRWNEHVSYRTSNNTSQCCSETHLDFDQTVKRLNVQLPGHWRQLSFPEIVHVIQYKWNFHQLPASWGRLFSSLHYQP